MAQEVSYVLLTPYSIQKSRTGGIIARLLSRTDLEFVGAKMLAPTEKFTNDFANLIMETAEHPNDETAQLLHYYVKESFPPHKGKHNRIMLLLFKGEDACKKIYNIVGKLKPGIRTGETIRDTYSDYILHRDGSVRYFEPAAITSPTKEGLKKTLKLLADFTKKEPNIINKSLYSGNIPDTKTLVIIKPDNWRYASSRPGNIIDMLSKTGLRIVGCKIYQMSVAEALEFYGPVKDVLREKLSKKIGFKAQDLLEKELQLNFSEETTNSLINTVGKEFADEEFANLVEFMTGMKPRDCPEDERSESGKVKSMILVYQGENCVEKIREVLGPTDPTKAPAGTIRREFGTNVMINTAHASDSYENAQREMQIVKVDTNELHRIIEDYLYSSS